MIFKGDMKINNLVLILIVALVAIGFMISYIYSNTIEDNNYSLAAASPGGTYFAMSGGLASVFNDSIEGGNLSVQTTAGSAENIRLLQSKEVDFALANGSEIYWAYNGEGFFEGQRYEDIRIITFGWTNVYHGVGLEKVESLEDLKGKKIGVGPRGSAAEIFHQIYYKEAGIWDDIDPVYLPPSDQVSTIKDGNLDTFGYFSGLPLSVIVDLASIRDIKFINAVKFGEDFNFSQKYPFYVEEIIPAGTYKGQDQDVKTYANLTYILAHKDVPEDLVYSFLKGLYSEEGLEYMKGVHNRAKEFDIRTIDKMVEELGAPLHQGAVKLMDEIK